MNTRSNHPSTGSSWVSNLVWLFVAFVILFVSYRIFLPRYHEYFLSQKIEDMARFGATNREKPEQLQQEVFDLSQREKIPLKLEDIVVTGSSTLTVHVTYSEPVNLVITKWDYKVDIEKNSTNW